MAYHFLDSKLDRAIVAYLIEYGAGSVANCFPALRSLDKILPNITVHTSDLTIPQGDGFSGSRVAQVEITISYKPVGDPASSDSDAIAKADAKRLEFNELTGDVCDALNKFGQSSDLLCDAINAAAYALAAADPDNHADLSDFQVYGLIALGEVQGFDRDGNWRKIFKLQCEVAATNANLN